MCICRIFVEKLIRDVIYQNFHTEKERNFAPVMPTPTFCIPLWSFLFNCFILKLKTQKQYCFLGRDNVYSDKNLQRFRRILLPPSSRKFFPKQFSMHFYRLY